MKKVSDEEKLLAETARFRHKCKCGHSVVIYPFEKKDKKICGWCKNYVYISKEAEFKDKLRKEISKNDNNR